MGFASGMFIGPLLLTGIVSALQKGPSHMVTFIVLFSATQTFGGLVGSSFFSTYQQMRTQTYQAQIYNDLSQTSPIVEQRLQQLAQSAHQYSLDPNLDQQQAIRSLNQTITREAQVRAYNDVIFLNGIFAVLLLLWGLLLMGKNKYQLRQQQRTDSS